MAKIKVEQLYNPKIVPENVAGKKEIDDKAVVKVNACLNRLKKQRIYVTANANIDIEKNWDEDYQLYQLIRDDSKHNYRGDAKVFMPIARKAVNTIESTSDSLLFGRPGYFNVDGAGIETSEKNSEAFKAYSVLEHYNKNEDWVYNFKLIKKQCLIYGVTACEVSFNKKQYEQMYRSMKTKPITDKNGEQLFIADLEVPDSIEKIPDEKYIEFIKETVIEEKPRVEVRDIYRTYWNIFSNDPEKEDMVYLDLISAQDLLILSEQGVYNKKAVEEMLKLSPQGITNQQKTSTYIQDKVKNVDSAHDKSNAEYEVKRFQGLFTIEDETTGFKKHEQYWIDIGEGNNVLRIMKNPLIRQEKTFSICSYDIMPNMSATDGVIDTIKALNYEINDKENQSLDAISENIKAPLLISKQSGIKLTDLLIARRKNGHPIFSTDVNAINKVQIPVNIQHINLEIQRLESAAVSTSGAIAPLSGGSSGTSADRSGKSLGLMVSKGMEQFSSFIAEFEKRIMTRSIQKMWEMIVLFSEDVVPVGDSMQNVQEVCGRFNIVVESGSEALKLRELRDSLLEFVSVLSTNDIFFNSIDPVLVLQDFAKASMHNMSRYVNPNNLYQKQSQMIDQLTGALKKYEGSITGMMAEVNRLRGVVAQTNRAQEVSPPPSAQDMAQQGQQMQGNVNEAVVAAQTRRLPTATPM